MFRHRPLLGIVIFAGLLVGIGAWMSQAADPSAGDLYTQGMQKYAQGDYSGALNLLRKVDAMQLATKEQRVKLYETMQDADRRLHNKTSPDDLLKQASEAQAAGQSAKAATLLEAAQKHPQATPAQKDAATAKLAEVKRTLSTAELAARQNLDQALADIASGNLTAAETKLQAIKASKADLGWFDNERVDRAIALVAERKPVTPVVPAAKPAAMAEAKPATPAAPMAKPEVKPAPAPVVAAKPAEVKPAAPAVAVKPAEVKPAAPAPKPQAVIVEKPVYVAPVKEVPKPVVAEAKPAAPAPVAAKPAEVKPVEVKPVPAPTPVVAAKPAEVKPAPAVPTGPAPAVKPAEVKPAVVVAKPAEQPRVVEVKPVQIAPAPAPVAVKPVETKPVVAEVKPVEKPAAPIAAATKPVDADLLAQTKVLLAQQKLAEGRKYEAEGNHRLALKTYQDGLAIAPENKDLQAATEGVQAKLAAGDKPSDLITTQLQTQQLLADAAVAEFNNSMNRAAEFLTAQNFPAASESVQAAKLTLDRRQTILSPATYTALRQQANAQSDAIVAAQRDYDAKQTALSNANQRIEQDEQRRKALMEREDQVQKHLHRALALRREQKYEKALEAVNQALFLDPIHPAAELMKISIEESLINTRIREDERKRAVQIMKHTSDNVRATIPYRDLLQYPSEWPQLTYERFRMLEEATGESEANREANKILMEKKLEKVQFDNNRLISVIEYLRQVTNLNITPNWPALQQAGVTPDQSVTLELFGVTPDTVLTRVTEQITIDETNPIVHTVDNGGVIITPQRALKVERDPLEIYDISDLMHIVPDHRVRDYSSIGNDVGSVDGGGTGDSSATRLSEEEVRTRRQEQAELLTTRIVDNVGRPTDWLLNGGTGTIAIDENNRMIVRTSPRNQRQIRELLSKLRAGFGLQITVEARFLAVTQNFLDEFGIALGMSYTPSNVFSQPITVDTGALNPSSNTGLLGLANRQASGINPSFTTNSIQSLNMGFTYLDDLQLSMIIRATQARRNIVTLNAPRVTFLNGKNAQINLARGTRYIEDLEVVTGAAAFNPTTELAEEGVFLEVEGAATPDRRYVTLNVYPKLTELIRPFRQVPQTAVVQINSPGSTGTATNVTISGVLELPERRTTEVKTTAVVPDRGTLLLGGQRLVSDIEVEAGVPILSKIPIINRFFTDSSTVKDEQILLILLKPIIIIPDQEENAVFPGLRDNPAQYNIGRGGTGPVRSNNVSNILDER